MVKVSVVRVTNFELTKGLVFCLVLVRQLIKGKGPPCLRYTCRIVEDRLRILVFYEKGTS